MERVLEWMLGFQGSNSQASLQIATRFPALLTALFRALDEDGDGRITVEAQGLSLKKRVVTGAFSFSLPPHPFAHKEFKAALEPDEPAG